ncbi:MAG: hypothetical protein B7Z15_04055 [Rhizobiales bacterium 32-66-8]|nr:MAG: hypothetical protein B7Z15_04055 [Rhizobiales bacterium 32-66-8]
MTVIQKDIAHALGLSEMTISRGVRAMGRSWEPLSETTALALLVVGELRGLGLSWKAGAALVERFSGEVRYCSMDPANRSWVVFVERPDISFQMSSLSSSHLDSILEANPFVRTLALHRLVTDALDRLAELKTIKALAA